MGIMTMSTSSSCTVSELRLNKSFHQSPALAVALNLNLPVELLNALPLVEFVGVRELEEIRGIEANDIC